MTSEVFLKNFQKNVENGPNYINYRYFDFVGKAIKIFLSFIMKFIKALNNTYFRHICRFERLGYEIEVHTQFTKHTKQKKKLT